MGIKIRGRLHNGRTLNIELPESLRGRYSEFPPRSANARITVDRNIAATRRGVVPMDFASPFFQDLIEKAQSPDFGGEYACMPAPKSGTLGLYKIRWQDDQGMPRWDALIPIFLDEKGRSISNPAFFRSLLTEGGSGLAPRDARISRKGRLNALNQKAHDELAARCSTLRHPNDVVLLATADLKALD